MSTGTKAGAEQYGEQCPGGMVHRPWRQQGAVKSWRESRCRQSHAGEGDVLPLDAVVQPGFERVPERVVVRPVDTREVQRLASELSVPDVVAGLLLARGLSTYAQCETYFNPRLEDLHDPFLFRDMQSAVDRVGKAIAQGEKIVVYGDYDVDGVTATAMLVALLRRLGADCEYYLPNRLTEGYGISEEAVRSIAGTGAALIITVDCGVTAAHEIGVARSLGMDVIVSDHHEARGNVPDCCPVLNPKLPGEGYPEQVLAGVGVALKLCQALCASLLGGAELWKEYLDLVALGTTADIVPLTGENRIIVTAGLQRLRTSENTGLRALIREQGLEATTLHTHHVVFQIAPCINAVGRLGDSRRAVELLLTTDTAVASLYARELAESNRERRALNERVEEEAVNWVIRNCDAAREPAIVAGHEDWHKGVIGIVASKLVERFYRPSILFSIEDGIAHGSGRTIPQLHLLDALAECEDLLQTYGGHAAAAGVTLKASNLPRLRERFNEVVRARTAGVELVPTITADAEVELGGICPRLFRTIERMRPFGPGNMRPVLLCRSLTNCRQPRIVGKNHLKLSVYGGGITMDAIGFGLGERLQQIAGAAEFGLAFTLDENEWNGRKSLQMKVKGVVV